MEENHKVYTKTFLGEKRPSNSVSLFNKGNALIFVVLCVCVCGFVCL